MKITAKAGRYGKIHIHIDGEYLLTVDSDFWLSCGYVSGDEINSEELAAFKTAASSRCAFNAGLNYLDFREYSVREIRTKLLRKFDEEYVDTAVEKLCELNLINDERYASLLANELFERKKYGKNRIKSELFKRGIDSDTINNVLTEIFDAEETDNIKRIVDIINKKYYNNMADENGRKKVFGALVRLGYGFSDIREAMRSYCDDEYYEEF
jgi:regulatory protein